MADPTEPPESIILGQFTGIKNTVSEERLGQNDLSAAVNVDIDDTGQVRRRRGQTLVSAGSYHSARNIAGRLLVVKDGMLGYLGANYAHTALVSVGDDPVAYTAVGDTIYFSSRAVSGKLTETGIDAWGQLGGEGTWLSPVVAPTDTLGEVAGRLLGPPPLATELEHYKGRIYLAAGKYGWATELYLYDLVDRTRGLIQFEDEITLIAAVEDGMYWGTTKQLFFLSGTFGEGLKRTVVVNAPVLKGSLSWAPTADIHPSRGNAPIPEGNSPVFITGDGICLGLDGGQVYNLTRGRVVLPAAVGAATLYREDRGVSQFVAVLDSAGGPAANARIGDYVDAEIIRAADRQT